MHISHKYFIAMTKRRSCMVAWGITLIPSKIQQENSNTSFFLGSLSNTSELNSSVQRVSYDNERFGFWLYSNRYLLFDDIEICVVTKAEPRLPRGSELVSNNEINHFHKKKTTTAREMRTARAQESFSVHNNTHSFN